MKYSHQHTRNNREERGEVNSKTLVMLKDKLIDLTTSNQEVNWLDVGCGNGRCLYVLDAIQNRDRIEYYGIDNSREHLDAAKKRAQGYGLNASFGKVDAASMKLDSKYDIISAILLLHEVDPLYLPYVLINMLRTLKDDGTLVISDFQGPYEQERDVVTWSITDIHCLLERIGVNGADIEITPANQYPEEFRFYSCCVEKSKCTNANEWSDELLHGYGGFLKTKKKRSYQEREELRSHIKKRVLEILNRPNVDTKNITEDEMGRILNEIEPKYGIKAYKIRLLTSQIEFLDRILGKL